MHHCTNTRLLRSKRAHQMVMHLSREYNPLQVTNGGKYSMQQNACVYGNTGTENVTIKTIVHQDLETVGKGLVSFSVSFFLHSNKALP